MRRPNPKRKHTVRVRMPAGNCGRFGKYLFRRKPNEKSRRKENSKVSNLKSKKKSLSPDSHWIFISVFHLTLKIFLDYLQIDKGWTWAWIWVHCWRGEKNWNFLVVSLFVGSKLCAPLIYILFETRDNSIKCEIFQFFSLSWGKLNKVEVANLKTYIS